MGIHWPRDLTTAYKSVRVTNLHRMDVIVIKKLLLLHETLVLQVTSWVE